MRIMRVIILAASLLAIAVPAAGAAQFPYAIHACSPGIASTAPPPEKWEQIWLGGLGAENNCTAGGGLSLGTGEASAFPDLDGWSWKASRNSDSVVAMFTVSGGDSSSGMVYEYAGILNGAEVTPIPILRPPGGAPETITLPMSGLPSLEFQAYCMLPACAASPPLVINDITFAISDDTPPAVMGSVGPNEFAGGELQAYWSNGSAVDTDINFVDDGVGLTTMSAVLSGGLSGEQELWSGTAGCLELDPAAITTTAFCDEAVRLERRFNLSAEADGIYQLKFLARDLLDNAFTSAEMPVGIDRSRPSAPTGLNWLGTVNSHGWTGNPAIQLGWNPAPEQPANGSPIDHAYWSLRKLDSAASSDGTTDNYETPPLFLSSEGRWRGSIEHVDEAGNDGERTYIDVGYDLDDPPVPELADNVWVSREGLIEGYDLEWTLPAIPPTLESGICGFALQIDGVANASPPIREDLPADARAYRMPPNSPEGTRYEHLRSVSCAGRGSATATKVINIDKTLPSATISGIPAQPWLTSATPVTIQAADPAGQAGQSAAPASGVASVHYKFDNGTQQTIAASSAVIQIPQGVHTLTYGATDVAGNQSVETTRVISIDASPPVIAFDAEDLADRLRIGATVTDGLSGMKSARIEFRRVEPDSTPSAWATLGDPQLAEPAGAASMRIVRNINDEKFADGTYEFRITAIDVAGNAYSLGDANGESTRLLRLPIRGSATISAAIADVTTNCRTAAGKACASVKKCPRKTSCRMVSAIRREQAATSIVRPYGAPTALIGEALSAPGSPLINAAVSVHSTELFGQSSGAQTVLTDSAGRFEMPIPTGPSREFSVRFAGDASYLPTSASAKLAVRTGVRFEVSKSKMRGGQALRLSGRLLGSAGRLPIAGKRVVIEFLTPAGWFPTIGSPLTDNNGRFAIAHKWPKTARRSTYLFRAHVYGEQPWPYAEASSKSKRVTVLP